MKGKIVIAVAMVSLIAFSGLVTACQGQALAGPYSPVISDVPVKGEAVWAGSYKEDIQPIFDQYCVTCHNSAQAANGLRLDTYQGVMKGTQYGRVIIPGEPGGSTLLRILYLTPQPQVHMPHGDVKLSKNRIENILLWIRAGATDN